MREEAVSEIPHSGEGELPLRNLKIFLGKGALTAADRTPFTVGIFFGIRWAKSDSFSGTAC